MYTEKLFEKVQHRKVFIFGINYIKGVIFNRILVHVVLEKSGTTSGHQLYTLELVMFDSGREIQEGEVLA